MSTLYGLWGELTSTWLTHQGRIIAHTSREELEWLVNGTAAVKPLGGFPVDEVLMLRDHPDMAAVTWPLKREDFRGR